MVMVNESTKLFFDSMEPAKKSELREKDEEGNTPLHWACFLGQLEVVRLLLKSGKELKERKNQNKQKKKRKKISLISIALSIYTASS
jgi:ankyrin repeat protein